MPSKDSYRTAAKKMKQLLDSEHSAFRTVQAKEITGAVQSAAGSGGHGGAEMESALLEEGLLVFPSLTQQPSDGYVRLYRSGTVIANILNAIRYPGSGSDNDLAQLIAKVKTPKSLSAATPPLADGPK